ncbi:AAA family ATPase [bacterium]|nr:AAA family ATPase [bacterium]
MPEQPATAAACRACGSTNPSGARFCNGCGTPLARDARAAAGAGERRQLTVLFCDLVGSTNLGARLDLEDYFELVRTYHDRADALIARYGGSVAQHQGDGIVAYFGWPAAHGDDAERAVRAGLAVAEEVGAIVAGDGTRLAARVGIHTGLVVVSSVGGGLNVETIALGDTTNVAGRVQTLGEAGSVLVTAATHRLVSGLFHVEDRGAPPLKGIAEPTRIYRVVRASGALNRLAAAAARGLTPFVGRASERALLRSRWERVQRGEGQVVLISGEAGIGKSRLVEQLKDDLRAVPHTRIECGGSPYHVSSAFYPVTAMLQQGFAGRGESSPAEKIEAIEQAVAQVGLPPATAVSLVAPLLDLPVPDRYPPPTLSPEQQRRELIASLVAWIRATARLQPTVVVVEDLHWVDPSTLELLALLAEQGADVPLLLLFTTRPIFRPPWPSRPHHAQMNLSQLTRDEVVAMITHLAAELRPSGPVIETLVSRTGGVPLFVEELVRMVVESPASQPRVPGTLQDSLMARLDRLGTGKQVARVASVIGRQFSYQLLRAIWPHAESELPAALAALVDAELIYADGALPDTTYLFKHVLIQEAAYDSLLKEPRAALHRAVAECLAGPFHSTSEAQPEVVAGHYTGAGMIPEAVRWWQTAGERASQRAAHAEAINHYGTALALLQGLPADPSRDGAELTLRVLLGLSLASARGYASPEVEQNYRAAHDLCRRLGETAELFPVVRGLCTFYIVRDNHVVANELAEQCLRIGEETRAPEYLIEGHNALGYTKFYLGELGPARALLETGVALYRSHRGAPLAALTPQDPAVACLSLLAAALWMLGYPEQGQRRIEEALALARSLASPFSLAYCCTYAATASELWRDFARSAAYSREAIAISTEHGFDVLRCAGTLHLGVAEGQLGEAEAGIARLTEALAEWRASGTEFMRSYFLAGLAEAQRAAGHLDAAAASVAEALAHAASGPDRFYEAELHRLRGELALAADAGAHDAAGADFERAIAIAGRQQARSLALRATVSLAELLRARDRRAEAGDLLRRAYAGFGEGFDTPDLRAARALLADLA